ncbi:MAG: winged helix-turn-helix transcriptional regulator [Clostridia bacterium]|nr:winged helix-turn-helix transcriptional regulator [Deltaproteobacteria bacterium]
MIWALRDAPLGFGQVRRAIPLATERMIARRLVELTEAGVITLESTGRAKRYRLSSLGKRIIPLLQTMLELGESIKRRPAWVPAESVAASF